MTRTGFLKRGALQSLRDTLRDTPPLAESIPEQRRQARTQTEQAAAQTRRLPGRPLRPDTGTRYRQFVGCGSFLTAPYLLFPSSGAAYERI